VAASFQGLAPRRPCTAKRQVQRKSDATEDRRSPSRPPARGKLHLVSEQNPGPARKGTQEEQTSVLPSRVDREGRTWRLSDTGIWQQVKSTAERTGKKRSKRTNRRKHIDNYRQATKHVRLRSRERSLPVYREEPSTPSSCSLRSPKSPSQSPLRRETAAPRAAAQEPSSSSAGPSSSAAGPSSSSVGPPSSSEVGPPSSSVRLTPRESPPRTFRLWHCQCGEKVPTYRDKCSECGTVRKTGIAV
jgi:hypothetical protein